MNSSGLARSNRRIRNDLKKITEEDALSNGIRFQIMPTGWFWWKYGRRLFVHDRDVFAFAIRKHGKVIGGVLATRTSYTPEDDGNTLDIMWVAGYWGIRGSSMDLIFKWAKMIAVQRGYSRIGVCSRHHITREPDGWTEH